MFWCTGFGIFGRHKSMAAIFANCGRIKAGDDFTHNLALVVGNRIALARDGLFRHLEADEFLREALLFLF